MNEHDLDIGDLVRYEDNRKGIGVISESVVLLNLYYISSAKRPDLHFYRNELTLISKAKHSTST